MTGESTWHRDKRLRTQVSIVAAAAELVAEGVAPDLAPVAARAGVSPRTVTRYFPNPADALKYAVDGAWLTRTLAEIKNRPPGEDQVTAVLCAAVVAATGVTLADERALAEKAQVAVRDAMSRALTAADWCERWRPQLIATLLERTGESDPGVEELMAAETFMALRLVAFERWAADDFDQRFAAHVAEVVAYFLHRGVRLGMHLPPSAAGDALAALDAILAGEHERVVAEEKALADEALDERNAADAESEA